MRFYKHQAKNTKKVEELVEEYHAQIRNIFKGAEPADLAINWKYKITEIDDIQGIDIESSNIRIKLYYYKHKPAITYYTYIFPFQALSEPKKYVYLKLLKEFGKKMRGIENKVRDLDEEIENWHKTYDKFKDLEKEVMFGEKNER